MLVHFVQTLKSMEAHIRNQAPTPTRYRSAHACCKNNFNPFMSNGISPSCQLDESISNFRIVGWYVSFLFKFIRNFCKQTVENLIRRRNIWRLIWICSVCLCPTKRTIGLYTGALIYEYLLLCLMLRGLHFNVNSLMQKLRKEHTMKKRKF